MTQKHITITESTIAKSADDKSTKLLPSQYADSGLIQLYVLTGHWGSDLKFYENELQFLQNFLDRYFMWLAQEKNIDHARVVIGKLAGLIKQREVLDRNTERHLTQLAGLFENPFSPKADCYIKEHAIIEDDTIKFLKDFRSLRKEILMLTEEILQSESVNHLLAPERK